MAFVVAKAPTPIEKARNRGKFQPCPLSSRRVWAFGASRAFRGYGCTPEEAITVLTEQWTGDPSPRTIAEAVSVVYETEMNGTGAGSGRYGKPDFDLIARTVERWQAKGITPKDASTRQPSKRHARNPDRILAQSR